MDILSRKKQKPVGRNQSREWLRNFIWESETKMLNTAPTGILPDDFSLLALHAMIPAPDFALTKLKEGK